MGRHVRLEKRGHVAIMTLDDPESLNALDQGTFSKLAELWRDLDDDPEIRAIVVTGAGRGFCSGARMSSLQDSAAKGQESDELPAFTARQLGVWKPVITAVNGVCAGAGLHFVADADIVIASDRASFVDTHVNVGQVSALEPIGLARRMPLGAVLRMVILGRNERLDAQEALRLHMVSEVVAHKRLIDRAVELAEMAAQGSPATVRTSLKAIWESLDKGLDEALHDGWNQIKHHRTHPDAIEGPLAFVEKREPKWTIG
ncbi:MAG TPA: enoyl-CoA hydratase/isomerase family protein [Deltaproteobacteria bacterium]|nr:enoyl-CoA hydratase/isomerase family protein [Deltaproteobacteria bacterium]